MTSEPLDELYFTWLYSQVGSVKSRQRTRTYWSLLRQLFKIEFVWFVPNDDNRAEEGRGLRYEWIEEEGFLPEEVEDWLDEECSVLEMLIALSRRLSFEDEGEPRAWFWHMLENLRISHLNDATYRENLDEDRVNNVIQKLVRREYRPNGQGGLFPLEHPERDQREVELWYQLNAYLIERD